MNRQMSESMGVGALLALAGGYMDAYSYMCRGGVFANAQTGNILLLAVNASQGKWDMTLRYALPVLAFALGIALADAVRLVRRDKSLLHWRQLTVALEAVVLCAVAFMPGSVNNFANALTSFACGLQVESFRKIHGHGAATTMCIGNLRTATQALTEFYFTRDRGAARRGLLFYGIIVLFACGAVLGSIGVELWAQHAILACPLLLAAVFGLLFIKGEDTVQ